ncbi:MAG: hypothetical protein WA699_20230 [Pseudolabrys sp.]|jgi:hypothetical protein
MPAVGGAMKPNRAKQWFIDRLMVEQLPLLSAVKPRHSRQLLVHAFRSLSIIGRRCIGRRRTNEILQDLVRHNRQMLKER